MRLDHLLSKEQAKMETSELHPKVDRLKRATAHTTVWKCSKSTKHDRHASSNTRVGRTDARGVTGMLSEIAESILYRFQGLAKSEDVGV